MEQATKIFFLRSVGDGWSKHCAEIDGIEMNVREKNK